MQVHTETLATALFTGINFKADFLYQKTTRDLFRLEQLQHSPVIDRGSLPDWKISGSVDTFGRAHTRVEELISGYQQPEFETIKTQELVAYVTFLAQEAGMDQLPNLNGN
jgi:trimethylamine:corrinoid methyltransferase-like protein